MHPKIKGYSKARNIVFASKIEEQKKLEERLKEKYKQIKNDTATKR
jgi:hypothetical protein